MLLFFQSINTFERCGAILKMTLPKLIRPVLGRGLKWPMGTRRSQQCVQVKHVLSCTFIVTVHESWKWSNSWNKPRLRRILFIIHCCPIKLGHQLSRFPSHGMTSNGLYISLEECSAAFFCILKKQLQAPMFKRTGQLIHN